MENRSYYLQCSVNPRLSGSYPLDWQTYFPTSATLAVEIGFGNGAFLVDWAKRHPNWQFVGFELSIESMERAQRKLFRNDVKNACVIHEDARLGLREFFPENSLAHVMMNFPDPWPKDKHRKRRLLDENFSEILGNVLRENHCYELVTDQQWYAEHAFELFSASKYFSVDSVELNPPRPVITKYEQKWREMGRETYRVLAEKKAIAPVERLLEDSEMPHAFIEETVDAASVKALEGFTGNADDKLFVVKSVYEKIDREGFLLQLIAKDAGYKQDFYVVINHNSSGRWLVKLDTTNPPYRTPAVKMAVWEIGKELNRRNSSHK